MAERLFQKAGLGSRNLLFSGDTWRDLVSSLHTAQHKRDLFSLELADLENSKAATAHATKLVSGSVGLGMISS